MTLQSPSGPVNNGDLSLKDVVVNFKKCYSYLLSKWIAIILFVLFGSILGYLYARSKKPMYTALTSFVLEESNSGGGLGNLGGLASMVGVDVGGNGGIFQGDNIIELYKSRTMIEKTLLTVVEANGKKELLIDHYITFKKLRDNWSKNPLLKNIDFKKERSSFNRLQDSVLGSVVTDIKTNYLNVSKPDKKLSIIIAEVKSPDEFFAKNFNDQIVKNVNDFYIQTKTKKSLENVAILQHQTDSVKAVLNGAIYSGAAIIDATPNLNPTRQILRVPIQRSQYNAEANKAILIQLVQNLELSKITLRKETPLIQVLDRPIYPVSVEKASKLKGIVLGGFVFGVLAVIFFLLKMIISPLLK